MFPAAFSSQSPGRLVPTIDGASAFVPNPAPDALPLSPSTIRLLTRADHQLGRLSGAATRLINPYLVSAQLLRREAILSSRIEQTFATPEQIALFELGTEARTPDAQEVGNFVQAMEHALGAVHQGHPITERLLLSTHRILMTDVRGNRERPGEFRTVQNYIGASQSDIHAARYVPPPHTALPALLSDLERLLNDDVGELPTLVRVAVAHYQFEAIHPFRDGNGRIGRLLILLALVREGSLTGPLLPISSAMDRRRSEYIDHLLQVTLEGAWESWIRFFLECVIESAHEALAMVTALDDLRSTMHAELQATRSSALLIKLADALLQRPAITIAAASQLLGVTAATASASINKLVDAGMLREITGRVRDRVYVAPRILATVSEVPRAITS